MYVGGRYKIVKELTGQKKECIKSKRKYTVIIKKKIDYNDGTITLEYPSRIKGEKPTTHIK